MPGPDFLDLPTRATKPRGIGITHVLDRGIPLAQSADLLAMSESYIDVWKLGWGISYLDPTLPGKLELLAEHGVLASPGGTLLEIAWAQGRAMEFLDWARGCGFPCVEVSAGTVAMDQAAKRELIAEAARHFIVLAEVGPKDPGVLLTPGQWAQALSADLEAGATWVLAEGRASGTVGIYELLRDGARGGDLRPGLGGRPGFPGLRGSSGAAAGVVRPPVRSRREPGQRVPGRRARAGDPAALAAGRHLRGLVARFAARASDVT